MSDPTTVLILVGTMSGTAEMVAEEMADALRRAGGFAPRVIRMERVDASVFRQPALFVLCTSTYGPGDPPDNAKKLYAELTEGQPDLSGVRYGVFGLGDRHHAATFGFGGRKFDELLEKLGATRMVERGLHDMRSGIYPEAQGLDWLTGWIEAARARGAGP